MLLFFGLTTTSLLNGQAVLIGTPTGGDANDPSLAVNNPTGVACAGGGTETWLDFDGVAGNNASQEGGMAIGARHNEDVLYTFPSQPAGDYLLFYEHANPGLLECDGTMLNGNGRWRFNIGNGNVNGPIIASGISTTMEWFKASVSMTATAAFTTLNMEARRQGALGNPYMQIDNVVLIAVPAGAGPCYMSDLGSPALNACYGTDVCFPQSNSCAEITPGDPHMNPAGCPVTAGDPDALVIIPIPDFDPDMDCAAAEAMTFDMVVPDLKVHYTYWGNCSPRSPEMPTVLDAQNQGFITQFFCDLDTDGLPAFPSGLSGESGIVDFIPANTEDAGCNGFVDEATSDCICGAGSNGTDPEDAGVELLQLDFWVAIPTYQTQVGFNFDNHTGNPVEGASFFAGPNTASMCEVNYYNFGGAGGDHNDEPQQPSGTYTLDHGSLLQDDCNASWLRVRVYMSDVKDRWGIIPQMDCGNGYGPISALPVAPAMSAGDNSQPAALTTMSVEGYSLLDTESGITFFYDALGNPKKYACNPVALVGDTGVCAGPCPVPNPIDVTDDEVCDGMLGTTISDWMDDVEADADNMAAIADAITGDAIIYSLDTAPTEAAPPTAGEADASHTGTGCANETETTYAYLLCLGADAAVGGGDDTYLLLGTHTLTVFPPAQDPMDVIDACINTPTAICPNDAFDAVATNATGGADVANWNGTTYTAQPGDAAGTIDLAVTTTNGCTGTFPIATPACPAMCPAVNPIDEMDEVCDGMLGTTISDWMMSVEADAANTAAIMDANTAAALIYSMDATPTETAPPTAGTADASHAGTGCANETETTYAYLLCLGADAAVGGGDDTYLLLGTHTLTVYPPAQDPMDVIDACTNTPTAICPNDAFDAVATNATGGADVANWNGTTYTAQPGDAAGTIDLAVTTTNGCTGTFPIATPACPAMCPAVNPIDEMDEVCDGMLGTTISDWMMSVEADAANTAAIMDANTAAALIYSMDATPTETAPPTAGTADASHAGTGCANETETTYAYLLCLGADAAVGGGDDTYLLLGTHTLTVYPPAQDPMDVIDACTNTPTAICAGDSFGAASNPTGGASIANWNASTGVYTAQTGDAAGTIDIAITTTNNCTESFEITTPDCGGMCPVVNPIFGTAAVCDGMLGTTISDWETSVEMNPANAAAIADANTAAAIIYSVDVAPTEATPPSAVTADASHSGTGCANETESTYAYLLCMGIDGAVGGGDDIYMLLGIHTLTVYPPAQDPTDNITGCTNTPTLICDDTFGAASNPSGGASTANWDSVTGVYTAQSGDAAGTIDIEITTSNGCTGIFEIATPACGSCDDAGLTGADICASITALGAASPFHGIDCDDDGENNEDECDNGTDPLDPCDNSYADGDAVCAAIVAGATGFAGLDCDGGGVDDTVECDEGTDPTDPCDDTGLTGADICASITALGTASPFHGIDCDGDGETNEDECDNGTDPLDPCDNSYADGDAVCAAIDAGATGFANVDCDGGGVSDEDECDDGTDPTDPCDDTGLTGTIICASIDAIGTASPFHGIDCDGDGETNEDECDNGTDPLDPCDNNYDTGDEICAAIDAGAIGFANVDCDGGGVSDEDECDEGTDPTDPCDDTGLTRTIICASIDALGTASPFHGIDCDGDGETNQDECDNGTDPLDPCDNNYDTGDEICAAIDAGATGFANVDCDGGGVNDEDECDEGTDPTDPCDDTGLTGTIICASLDALGTASPFHGIDCDGDGETNEVECDNGTDPLDPCDNNYDTGDEICAAILAGATGFADVDCDGGGVNDEQECANGTDPTDPCDDNPPAAPATECWETATYNNTTCIWEITGTQPAEPTNIECWETATFNNTTCTWNVTGTQPTEPTTECYQTATFNNTTCVWVVSGTQAAEPATECWETATFNNTNCTWNVTGTQPAEPTIECFEVAIFNNTTCLWEVSGSATEEPNIQCWETATFNATICSWVITGTQPREPDTECWETATFNNAICAWEVTGTLPADPGCDDGDCTNGMETWDGCDCIEGTPPVIGCTNPLADNYNPAATCDDASCEFGAVDDCPDPGNCDDNICENGIEMWDFDLCECVSGIAPDNCDDLEIISFDFDDCHAMTTDMSHTDYSEFQPEYPNTLDCGTIVASILHRDEPDTNSHSCTPGLDNSSSMCVSSLESCDADFTSNKAVKFSITVSPLAGDTITISSLQFMQNAPVNFDWINGSSGLNNYPTLYGIQVLQNGTIIYSQEDLSTSTAWTQEVHNFTGVSSIEISQQTTLDILLLSYCPVGVQSNVTAWDLENLKVFGSCNESLVGSRMISGKITSLNNEQFDDVLMTIEGGDNLVSAMADSNGEYSFADNSIGETYVVSAFKDSDYLKGISTLDLLIIQRHILGISTFNDPLLYHAADINNDSNISAIDLIDLRKLILGIIDEFPENLSYRFFDESKVRNDSNPWLLPEEIMVINLETDEYALDFNPIKVGDVTSLIAKKKTFNNRSNDSDNHIELYSSKTDSRYSDIVTTNFYITEQLSINGFQLAIDLKESEFGKLIASNQMLNDIDYHVSDDNILRILWTGEIHFASGENLLFSIQTTASHHDHKLSSVISPEIYVDTDAIKMQLIKNNSSLANSSITNLRVYPNPFSDKTEVEFDLINDSKVDIHLYDTAGKLLYRENRPFVKGKNRIPLNEELFTSGIYFIKVSTDKESLTDRLVKLK